jgi:potassium-transporting ATPase KdpC subunit
MKALKDQIRITTIILLLMTSILGLAYPLALCWTGKIFFPHQASGSILKNESDQKIGSKWIGQNFTSARYFHPRPSHAGGGGYNAMASGGSNLGPTSQKLYKLLQERIEIYRLENNLSSGESIPVDAVTASGSGLDPHISLENAYLQAPRIAGVRNIPVADVRQLIEKQKQGRFLRIFGEPRLNILLTNIELDRRFSKQPAP